MKDKVAYGMGDKAMSKLAENLLELFFQVINNYEGVRQITAKGVFKDGSENI